MTVAQWSGTAALNVVSSGTVGTGGTNIDEGMAPSGVNDAIRDVMAQLATWRTAATFTGAVSVSAAVAGGTMLSLTNTDAGANGVWTDYYANSASPAVSDFLHVGNFYGNNSAAAKKTYGQWYWQITDPTNGSEDSSWFLFNQVAGVFTQQISVTATGLQIPAIGASTPGTGAFTTLSATGALTISGAGAGQIVFPASQNPSAGANTFDDYEEGTFTPTSIGTTIAGVGTYTGQNAQYTKIGNVVNFTAFCSWSAHTGTGNLRLASLPFTAQATNDVVVAIRVDLLTFAGAFVVGRVAAATTQLAIDTCATGASVAAVPMDTATGIQASGIYFV